MEPILTIYLQSDVILLITAAILLILGAWYDRNGSAVPDYITIPYALVGVMMSVIYERYITAFISTALLAFIVQPWRPKWLRNINEYFMLRAYGADEEHGENQKVEEREKELVALADEFELRHGDKIRVAVRLSITFMLGGLIITERHYEIASVALRIRLLIGAVCVLILCAMYLENKQKKAALQQKRETEEAIKRIEGLSALGGADCIVLIGMFAFYGFIPFTFCAAATFLIHIVLILCTRVKRHVPVVEGGDPLLPSICVTMPVRLYLASVVCVEILQNYTWLLQNMF